MTINKVTDFFVAEQLAEAVKTGFAGMKALLGTEAATLNLSMPHGKNEAGTAVKIPYFTNIGEFDDIAADGDALTPATISSSAQSATVLQSGKAFEMTQWAQFSGYGDPYEVVSQQVVEGAQRRIDKALIDTAVAASGALVQDSSGIGSGLMTYDAIIAAKLKWVDEQDAIALMVVHSKVFGDMLAIRDALGRPMLTDIVEGGLSKFAGIPVMVSDRVPLNTGVYSNILCKKGSLVAWVNGSPSVKVIADPLTDSEIVGTHIYYASHRYNPMPGLTKSGVVTLKTK